MKLICILMLMLPIKSFSQKSLDTKITVELSDTTGLYEKVRMSFVNSDMIVKDNRRKDTLTTYPFNIKSTTYIYAYAAISGNKVEYWGYIADANTNTLGITVAPGKRDYKKVFYYKGDKYWKKLLSVASLLGGSITFGK